MLYLGANGFLVTEVDERQHEYEYLRKRGMRISCIFGGSEIRSIRRMQEKYGVLGEGGMETIADYAAQGLSEPEIEVLETRISRRAELAEHYCTRVWNSPNDQLSYFRGATETFQPFLMAQEFNLNLDKFKDVETPRILHAPSSPTLKGTQIVRAAISRLQQEGFKFDYVELKNCTNSEVLDALKVSHIVLNEFYSFVPGVFGLEALANCNVLLTRASSKLDPSLQGQEYVPWLPTEPSYVYENLRKVLEEGSAAWSNQALKGYRWAVEFGSVDSQGVHFAKRLSEI